MRSYWYDSHPRHFALDQFISALPNWSTILCICYSVVRTIMQNCTVVQNAWTFHSPPFSRIFFFDRGTSKNCSFTRHLRWTCPHSTPPQLVVLHPCASSTPCFPRVLSWRWKDREIVNSLGLDVVCGVLLNASARFSPLTLATNMNFLLIHTSVLFCNVDFLFLFQGSRNSTLSHRAWRWSSHSERLT